MFDVTLIDFLIYPFLAPEMFAKEKMPRGLREVGQRCLKVLIYIFIMCLYNYVHESTSLKVYIIYV